VDVELVWAAEPAEATAAAAAAAAAALLLCADFLL